MFSLDFCNILFVSPIPMFQLHIDNLLTLTRTFSKCNLLLSDSICCFFRNFPLRIRLLRLTKYLLQQKSTNKIISYERKTLYILCTSSNTIHESRLQMLLFHVVKFKFFRTLCCKNKHILQLMYMNIHLNYSPMQVFLSARKTYCVT